MITASGIRRLQNCPSSAVLARAENYNVWAEAGTIEHEELSDVADEDHDFAWLIPPSSRSEVKLAYDVKTGIGRILGEGAGRDYGTPGPNEIVGSTDVVGALDGVAVIIDWKTGFNDVAPAASNEQLWFYGLAAARALKLSTARVIIAYTKTGRIDSHDIGPLELAEFADSLLKLHTRVEARQKQRNAGEEIDTREGDWCRHCPSKHLCPSKNALLVQFATGGLAVLGDAAMTAERAPAAYRQIIAAEQLVKDARARLIAFVDDNGPIDLGNGLAYGRYAKQGPEKLDAKVVGHVIRELVGEDIEKFEAIAFERKTTKAAIKRAVEQTTKPAKLNTAIIKRVKELGGAKSSLGRPVGEFDPKKYESAAREEMPVDQVNAALAGAAP